MLTEANFYDGLLTLMSGEPTSTEPEARKGIAAIYSYVGKTRSDWAVFAPQVRGKFVDMTVDMVAVFGAAFVSEIRELMGERPTCAATTAKGWRCLRSVSASKRRCAQHQRKHVQSCGIAKTAAVRLSRRLPRDVVDRIVGALPGGPARPKPKFIASKTQGNQKGNHAYFVDNHSN